MPWSAPTPAGSGKDRLRFYTAEECKAWLSDHERVKPDEVPDAKFETIGFPAKPHGFFYFAQRIAQVLSFRQPVLLWMTEWGIWGSSENWHLYYKLRQSYGDNRLLHEAPGHLFLDYETEDIATFLQVAMLNGWGGYLISGLNYVNAFFSHDEYVNFYIVDEGLTSDVQGLKAEIEKK
jgi:hypothetical protein